MSSKRKLKLVDDEHLQHHSASSSPGGAPSTASNASSSSDQGDNMSDQQSEELEEEESNAFLRPVMCLASDGKSLVVDPKSLFIQPTVGTSNNLTDSGFQEPKKGASHWKDKEIDHFELALRVLGTDFTVIASVIPSRNRMAIKKKFTFYDQRLPNFFRDIMLNPLPFNEQQLIKGVFPMGIPRIIVDTKSTPSKGKQATKSPSQKKARTPKKSTVPTLPSQEVGRNIAPEIVNVVSTFFLGIPIDTRKIARMLRNAEFEDAVAPRVILKHFDPKTTALVYDTGKVVCSGARTSEDAKVATRKFARLVQRCGYEIKYLKFQIENIVATAKFHVEIDLVRLSENFTKIGGKSFRYEPENFIGLIYAMEKPNVTVTFFDTGKVNVTGAKKIEDINDAYDEVLDILKEFMKK